MLGFLLFGLYGKIGVHAVWISRAVFAALHFSKPAMEIPVAFFSGILLSALALKTKSFIPPAIAHFLMALTLNILVNF